MGSQGPLGGPQKPAVPQTTIARFTPEEMRNIQGDILLGLPKQSQRFWFFKIVKNHDFRQRLGDVIPLITTCVKTQNDREAIRRRPRREDCLHMGSINVAFSWEGLKKIDPAKFKDSTTGTAILDKHFEEGMEAHRLQLRDDPINWNPKNWTSWDGKKDGEGKADTKGFEGKNIHGVVLVVGEDDRKVQDQFDKVASILGDSAEEVIALNGKVRPDKEAGHEHFGFKDGISQPFVLGTEGWGKDSHELPGQGHVKPGVILFGREGDNEEVDVDKGEDASGKPQVQRPPWAMDGSLMAFRYLHQKVPEFDRFLEVKATSQVSSELLGARFVGRWKSGAPIDIADRQDDPVLADDENKNNDFVFKDNDNDPANPHSRCPFAAHIRKTNPRGDLPPGNMSVERIIRRGIPYGEEVEDSERQTQKTSRDRGLLFACYQSHISRGFDLMQRVWANNPNFIVNKTPRAGVDPIIGQTHKSDTAPADARNATGMISINADAPSNQPPNFFDMGDATDEWVVSRGGEYFFSPSIMSLEKYIAI